MERQETTEKHPARTETATQQAVNKARKDETRHRTANLQEPAINRTNKDKTGQENKTKTFLMKSDKQTTQRQNNTLPQYATNLAERNTT